MKSTGRLAISICETTVKDHDILGDANDTMRAALTQAVDTHASVLFRVAQRIVHNPTVAEDICQTALMRAWQQRDRIENPAALKGWLNRVTVNESLQWLRRRKLEKAHQTDPLKGRNNPDPPMEQTLADRQELILALEQLPEQQRHVVILRIVHGYSGREVSEMLEMTDVQVSRALHGGLDQMRDTLNALQVPNRVESETP